MSSQIEQGAYRWAQRFLILIVDDDVHMVSMLRTSLESEGYRVDVAMDGLSGKQKAYEIRPDIILADILMPGIDGFSMMESIKAQPDMTEVPIIFLSGEAAGSMIPPPEEIHRKYALLKKPIFLPELNQLIKRFLS